MKTDMPRLLFAVALPALLSGCVTGVVDGAGRTAGPPAPPAPLPEIRSLAPVPGMVWVAGWWHWDGTAYVWLPGRWESPPPLP
jgi:hypothetical protein